MTEQQHHEELLEALEATLDGLKRASRQLTYEHRIVLGGKVWGGLLIENAERAIANAKARSMTQALSHPAPSAVSRRGCV